MVEMLTEAHFDHAGQVVEETRQTHRSSIGGASYTSSDPLGTTTVKSNQMSLNEESWASTLETQHRDMEAETWRLEQLLQKTRVTDTSGLSAKSTDLDRGLGVDLNRAENGKWDDLESYHSLVASMQAEQEYSEEEMKVSIVLCVLSRTCAKHKAIRTLLIDRATLDAREGTHTNSCTLAGCYENVFRRPD